MKNIRIASLEPDRPVSGKDCQICCRRRIRCDRTLPHCRKCEVRKLVCPGYAPKLRWGKVAGQSYHGKDIDNQHRVVLSLQSGSTSYPVQLTSTTPRLTLDVSPVEPSSLFHTAAANEGLSPTRLMWNNEAASLIQHFQDNIAGLLSWVDYPDNRWRSLIVPLASTSPTLMFSVSSLSAAHLESISAKSDGREAVAFQLAGSYRDESLKLLNMQLKDELNVTKSPQGGVHDLTTAYQLLATMLVLCHTEMIFSDSTVWRIHMRACRTAIRNILASVGSIEALDETAKFLIKEVMDLEVFASITTFVWLDEDYATPAVLSDQNFTWHFTDIVRDITIAERQRHRALDDGQDLTKFDLESWQERLDNATVGARRAVDDVLFENSDVREKFLKVVRLHHLAGLVYSLQALSPSETAPSNIHEYITEIYDILSTIDEPFRRLFPHVFSWPLFIAGAESRGKESEIQAFICEFAHSAMRKSGFGCNKQAVTFIRSFWNSDQKLYPNWIAFARAFLQNGEIFMVY